MDQDQFLIQRPSAVSYPDWSTGAKHPGLTVVGRKTYNLQNDVEEWFSEKQLKGESVRGEDIYLWLWRIGALEHFLGLEDAVAIQEKGPFVFRELFQNKAPFFFRSVTEYRPEDGCDSILLVPCLSLFGERVVLDWVWLSFGLGPNNPALRFK